MTDAIKNYIQKFSCPTEILGANFVAGKGVFVKLWAPKAKEVAIKWVNGKKAPLEKRNGYFSGHFPEAKPGDTYWFYLDGEMRIADPASRFQPEDTNGPSQVFADDYKWSDKEWKGVPFDEWIIYEIHTGAYSPSHDFAGIIADLPRLKKLGITTIELMPVSQFSGERNWGYDGVFPHAVQHSYGGPQQLKALVDACHAHGIAIILDVVYNHIGPEGNVLFHCGLYESEKYKVPWGEALNFDGEDNADVRRYFLQSAWQWLTEFHFDGLRLDAVQMIFDNSATPFLQELYHLKTEAEKIRGHHLILIGESDMNDCRMLMPPDQNGFGMDAQWADDFHHALHATLTGENDGYYADYGGLAQLARIYDQGVAFEGEYSPYRRRPHGRSYAAIDRKCLVVETQNHDQTGNRLKGERLITLTGFKKAKLGAACVLLSPFTPFLFMGEEFACAQPFLYFISHHDQKLIDASRESRKKEWQSFGWAEEPPDPGDINTFLQCVLGDKEPLENIQAAEMQTYYSKLISLSKEIRKLGRPNVACDIENQHITLEYANSLHVLFSFNDKPAHYKSPMGEECILQSVPGHEKDVIQPFSANVWRLK